ncbi:MAG TPA: poly-gamma-glutamate hydrolase family protein [Steroidobacteraceae bacterium]|nr:poly-gamma-glutamate hydrolase family protein [Steroidobacteraceae bacterium]
MLDRYTSFAELIRHERHGSDYRTHVLERPASAVLVIAPHGGTIESGTSELALAIAGADHNLYLFEGLRSGGRTSGLHLTSHRFDDPDCLRLASRCSVVLTVHGCTGESSIFVGGLDRSLAALMTGRFIRAGYQAADHGHGYPGRHPENVCNRGSRGRGVQLEFTADLRTPGSLGPLARLARKALDDYILSL